MYSRALSSSLEILENRIAPAGLVTVSFSEGLLIINGADGADHDVEVIKTGENTFRVQGNATGINSVAQMARNYVGVLDHVRYTGGAGADTFELTNLNPLISFRFEGGPGVDTLDTTNLRLQLGSRVNIDLGAETGSIDFNGALTVVHGLMNINLGGGGTVDFRSTTTTVDENVTITGGSASDSVLFSGDTATLKRQLIFNGGDGNDFFTASGNVLEVRGLVSMDGGAGTDAILFSADANKFGNTFSPRDVDLKLGEGTGTISFLGNSSRILGDLKIDLGVGGGLATLRTVTVQNNVLVNGGAGNDTLEFEDRITIGETLAFSGGVGDNTVRATGSLFSVNGNTSMIAGSGAGVFEVNVTTIAMAGFAYTGGTDKDSVSIVADGNISGNVNVQMGLDGTGPSSTTLQSKAGSANGLKFGAGVTINMVGATVDFLTIANIQVANAFDAQTGENVTTVSIAGLNGQGNVTLRTGDNADVVNIDNIRAQDLLIDTQSGADGLRIERLITSPGTSQVLGIATILTGIGADQIRIGNAIDPANTKVFFSGPVTIDGGDGPNMINDVVAANSFVSQPVVTATGGTMTQTEAV